jgi:hypothetical protein
MTPETRALLSPETLSRRLLGAPVVDGLNNQLRLRMVGDGLPSQREFVPDNDLTRQFMDTKAWPNLERQLRVAASGADSMADKTRLVGFVIPRDNQAALSAELLSQLEEGVPDSRALAENLEDTAKGGVALRALDRTMKPAMMFAGAWNEGGWITLMPDTARAVLVQAGAYRPRRSSEADMREAGEWAPYIAGAVPHEVQHSVTWGTPRAGRPELSWIEEGTADLFSQTWPVKEQHARAAGISEQSYAQRLGHPLVRLAGWGPFTRKTTEAQDDAIESKQQTNYIDSQVTLKKLLRLAGVPSFQTVAGREQARELLQGKSLLYVPGVLADAIIKQNGLNPAVREHLRQRIISANDSADGVTQIAQDFGIGTASG